MVSERSGQDEGEKVNQLERIKGYLRTWTRGLAAEKDLHSDAEQRHLRKAVLILLSVTCTIFGIFWGMTYFYLGRPLAGSFPLGYSALSAASLGYYYVSKRYNFFCCSQLFLILILPVFLQWSLWAFQPQVR